VTSQLRLSAAFAAALAACTGILVLAGAPALAAWIPGTAPPSGSKAPVGTPNVGAAPTFSHGVTFQLAGIGWASSLDLTAQVDTSSVPGTSFNAEDDLGIDPDQSISFIEATMGGFAFSAIKTSYSGTSTITRDIDYNGSTFSQSTDIASAFDFSFMSAVWNGSIFGEESRCNLRWTFGLSFIAIDGTLTETSTMQTESKNMYAPFPAYGLRYQQYVFASLVIAVEVQQFPRGDINLNDNGVTVEFDRLTLELEWVVVPTVSVRVGMRSIRAQYGLRDDDGDSTVVLNLTGRFVALVFKV
jgi:hypothetical protein